MALIHLGFHDKKLLKKEECMATALLGRLLSAAKSHGDQSDPDHEVGDLQALLASCWNRMTPRQRRDVYEAHRDMVSEWLESS
jgi:hypothetical protein